MAGLARRLTEHALLRDRIQLVNKRNNVQHSIDRFQAKAGSHWRRDKEAGHSLLPPAYSGNDWDDIAEDPDVAKDMYVVEEPEDEIQPEQIPLQMPSAFGHDHLEAEQKTVLGQQELRLREGQANDALHRIRINIGLKSVVFQTRVHQADSQQKKTRAWKEVQGIAKAITEQARIYTQAR